MEELRPYIELARDLSTRLGCVSQLAFMSGADLAVKMAGPATAKNDAQVTYTITITNNGAAAATGVVATDKASSRPTRCRSKPSSNRRR